MITKQCSKCKKKYPANLKYFASNKIAKDGLHSWCRKCKREIDILGKKEYRKKHPELRFGKLNPTKEDYEKWKVNYKIYLMIKAGKLKKQPCEVCGNVNAQAHHDDYSKPLEIRWLCQIHHSQLHSQLHLDGCKN